MVNMHHCCAATTENHPAKLIRIRPVTVITEAVETVEVAAPVHEELASSRCEAVP
jgi:hypothetical protein